MTETQRADLWSFVSCDSAANFVPCIIDSAAKGSRGAEGKQRRLRTKKTYH